MTDQEPKTNKRRPSDLVVLRNYGLYATYRRMITLTIMAIVVAILSVVVAVYSKSKTVPPQYIPLNEQNEVIRPIPLDQPNKTDASITEYALRVIRAVNTYDYINWRDQLQGSAFLFTPDGWNAYVQAFTASNTIKAVEDGRMIVKVVPTGDVKIIKKATAENGVFVWVLSVPIEITYIYHDKKNRSTLKSENKQRGSVQMYIVRVPNVVNPNGIGVEIYNFIVD